MSESALTLFDLAEALRVDIEDFGLPRRVLAASRSVAPGLPALVLSLCERDGRSLGVEGRAELHRLRTRAAAYRDLAWSLSDLSPVVCKGATIAGYYPPGLDRHVGDLDLMLPDEDAVWAAAGRVANALPVTSATVQRAPVTGDLAISLWWDATSPLYEPDPHVDLFTTPFWGDGLVAGVRAADRTLSDATQSVLVILEERFQRDWRATDDLDLRFLLPEVDAHELQRGARSLGLEDALSQLSERVGYPAPRASTPDGRASDIRIDPVDVGMPLETSLPYPQRPYELVTEGTTSVLRSPFGAFLMVGRADVPEEAVRRAESLLADPHPEQRPGAEVRRL